MDDRFRRDQTASNDCQVESQLIHLNDERIAYKRGACASMFSPERLYRPESFDPGAFAREAQQALTTSDNRPLDRSGTRERAARAMAASQPYGSLRRIRLRASLRSQEACLP